MSVSLRVPILVSKANTFSEAILSSAHTQRLVDPTDISVVIPTYNSAHCLHQCIDSIRSSMPDCAIVVADNASTDGTVLEAEAFAWGPKPLRVVQMGRNCGFGTAANAGVTVAPTERIVLLNPDVRLHAIGPAGEHEGRSARPFHGLAGIALVSGVAGARVTRRERPWWWECVGQTMMPFRLRGLPRLPELPFGARWASGAALAFTKSEFFSVGGFDQRFFMYSEDRDLARRYRLAGLPVGETRMVGGMHDHGSSSEGSGGDSPMRLVWSLLGWVEYVSLSAGSAAAGHAVTARLTGTDAATDLVARIVRLRSGARLEKKIKQIQAVQSYLRAWIEADLPAEDPLYDDRYYPLARAAVEKFAARDGWLNR